MSDEMKSGGFIQMGWKVAGSVVRAGLSERESVALTALKEWRAADTILLKSRAEYEQFEAGGDFTADELVKAYISLMRLVHAEEAKRNALRAAADALEDEG